MVVCGELLARFQMEKSWANTSQSTYIVQSVEPRLHKDIAPYSRPAEERFTARALVTFDLEVVAAINVECLTVGSW